MNATKSTDYREIICKKKGGKGNKTGLADRKEIYKETGASLR